MVPALGPLSIGHLLIITKRHVTSFSQLDSSQLSTYQFIVDRIVDKLSFQALFPIEFEHGATTGDCSGSCILHAHMHLAFTKINCSEKIKPKGILSEEIHADSLSHFKDRPYIYWSMPKNRSRTAKFFSTVDISRQEIRRSIGVLLKNNKWDWELFPNYQLTEKNIVLCKNILIG